MIPDDVRRGLALCVPLSGRPVSPEWAFALKSLDPPINYNIVFMCTKGLPVDEARNRCVKWAIEQRTKYLFFLDEDTIPPGHTLRHLIFLLENNPDVDMIGGVYFSKCETPAPLVFRGNGNGSYWGWKVGELFEVTGIGMGCTLIRTSLFERIPEPWFLTIKADAHVDDVAKQESWTEDLYFCDKVGKVGARILCDASILCDHYDVTTGKKYNLPWNSLPALRGATIGKKRILDLGCGERKIVFSDGVPVRVDAREDVNPDYRCDLRSLPFASESYDIVYSSHTLEHFNRDEIPRVLDEWLRVLAVGGELRLIVPDLTYAAKQILNGGLDAHGMNVLYGQQDYALNFHRTGFTPESLRTLLTSKGLAIKKLWTEEPYNLFVEAIKTHPRGLIGDGQGRAIEAEKAEVKQLPPAKPKERKRVARRS